jgi:5-methylcytosine-specific restriction protein A
VGVRALKVCIEAGCPELSDQSRCERHRRDTRPSASRRGYGVGWRKRRELFLAVNPTCIDCLAPATVADHDPLTRDELIRRGDPDPDAFHHLKPRCASCHSRKTATRDGGFGRTPGGYPNSRGEGTVRGAARGVYAQEIAVRPTGLRAG